MILNFLLCLVTVKAHDVYHVMSHASHIHKKEITNVLVKICTVVIEINTHAFRLLILNFLLCLVTVKAHDVYHVIR